MTFLGPLTDRPETRRHVFLVLENFTQLAFSCAMEPLRLANGIAGRPIYDWQTVSMDGSPVTSSCGTVLGIDAALGTLSHKDTLVVVGSQKSSAVAGPALLAHLRRSQAHGVRIIGLCGAVEVLAAAGMLDGQECAISWPLLDSMAERYPQIEATDRAFTLGKVPTAATGVAACDLMLHLIGSHCGQDIATAVADSMTYGSARHPVDRQRVSVQAMLGVRSDILSGAIRLMEANLATVLPVSEIGDQLGISVRQIERLFARHLKDSPTRYYMRLRLARARALLRDTELSVIEISAACGFAGASNFSKTYRKHFGTSPQRYRVVELSASCS